MNSPQQQLFYKQLGARIRILRGNRMTQEELANLVGLTRTSIVNIEAGEQKLLTHNLLSIAKAIGVSSAEIIGPLEQAEDVSALVKDPDGVSPVIGQWMNRAISKAIKNSKS